MSERFTDRVRQILALASQEAKRFNHEYVGTEHILLGLLQDSGGIATQVLLSLAVDIDELLLEVQKMVRSGQEMVTIGKLPQTRHAINVLDYAEKEARLLGNSFVGTEHLLLGLMREKNGIASRFFKNRGLKLEDVRLYIATGF